ncbi:MAG TPA: dicarboxylate/amino acid:cation symporter [Blastocatellia bacterium]|nr:dicarboxylate/amino acid:cation symporter [Blastocatellia bacterium]
MSDQENANRDNQVVRRRSPLRQSIPALIGLAAGLVCGVAISASGNKSLERVVSVFDVAGTLWINAILMTIIPLIVSNLFVGIVTTASAGAVGKIGLRAVLLFILLLSAAAAITAFVAPALMSRLSIDAATSESLRAAAAAAAPSTATPAPAPGQWFTGLIPTNVIKAAGDAAILPLIFFSVVFALAATRITSESRQHLVRLFQAINEAIQVVLGWVVGVAPAGIFALALVLAARVGAGLVGALAYYIVVASVLVVLLTLMLYFVAALGGGVSLRSFAAACVPAQIIAFSTHSSLASLPAMIKGAETRLRLPPSMTGFVLPLAVSTFKFSGPIWYMVVVFFVSRLYGIPLTSSRVLATIATSVLASITIAGVPSGAIYVAVPVLVTAGLPVEVLGLLLAIDAIPNAFRTMSNVTGNMTAAVVLSRFDSSKAEAV